MKFYKFFHSKKSRRYPIRRDEDGLSMRQQAFVFFKIGARPSEIYKRKLVKAKKSTLFRYYQDWQRDYPHLALQWVKKINKEKPEFNDQLIEALSKELNIPVEEVIKGLDQPWGLKQALLGEKPDYSLYKINSDVESRLLGGLYFMRLSEILHKSPEDLAELLMEIMLLNEGDTIRIIKSDKTKIWKIIMLEDGESLRMVYSEE